LRRDFEENTTDKLAGTGKLFSKHENVPFVDPEPSNSPNIHINVLAVAVYPQAHLAVQFVPCAMVDPSAHDGYAPSTTSGGTQDFKHSHVPFPSNSPIKHFNELTFAVNPTSHCVVQIEPKRYQIPPRSWEGAFETDGALQ